MRLDEGLRTSQRNRYPGNASAEIGGSQFLSYRDQIFRRDRILNKSPMTHTISPRQMQDKNGG